MTVDPTGPVPSPTLAFELLVVVSADGFIARRPGEHPGSWASAEEQRRFAAAVPTYDWAFMGRTTHLTAFKRDRRRVVFSSTAQGLDWREANHLWVDPASIPMPAILAALDSVRPLRRAVVLGGTMVHDWFLARGLLTRIDLSIEPIRFGTGLPVFRGDKGQPLRHLVEHGWRMVEQIGLNDAGSQVIVLEPGVPGRSAVHK